MARWLDLDQDGDLDLYVVNYCAAEHADKAFLADKAPPPGLANSVYRNDGQPEPIPGSPAPAWAPLAVAWENVKAKRGLSLALVPWTGVEALLGGEAPHTGIAALDLDGDRDLDLVLTADGSAPLAVLNDRLGNFHEVVLEDLAIAQARLGASGRRSRSGRPRRPGRPLDSRASPCPSGTRPSGPPPSQTRITFEPLATSVGPGARRSRPISTWTAFPTWSACRRRMPSTRGRLARRLGPQRGQATHRAGAARGAGDPGGRGGGPGRPGRRSAAGPACHPHRRGPGRGPQPGERQPLAGPAARRSLAGQARADAHQLARHRNPGDRGGAGDPRLIRPHDARFGPRAVDRPGGRSAWASGRPPTWSTCAGPTA